MATQLIQPNPNIACKPGWCLAYVNEAFGVPKKYGTATAAWNGSKTQHRDRNFPTGVWFAVWYGLVNEPAGHVVLMAPDGSCYSTSDLSNKPYHHPNLTHLENFYAYYGMTLTYRGWTEDVEDTPVINLDGINYSGTITPQEDSVALSGDDHQFILEAIDDYFKNVRPFAGNRNIIDALNQTRTDIVSTKAAVEVIPQKVLFDNRIDGRNLFDWAKQIRADIAGIKPGSIDIPTLAAALAEQLPKSDVAELAKQLQITVKDVA